MAVAWNCARMPSSRSDGTVPAWIDSAPSFCAPSTQGPPTNSEKFSEWQ